MEQKILDKINEWSKFAVEDLDLVNEYQQIKNDEKKLLDAFFKELSFGTGGLRGELGFGTNRMNIYNIRKATQGVVNYLLEEFKGKQINVAISYDSRIKSDVFAREAAKVLGSAGIHVYIYKQLMPVPLLSFATRELKCDAGIMVTASHNPSKYNGYKVYGSDGCQITEIAAGKILAEINKTNPFEVKTKEFDELLNSKVIEYIPNEILDKFINIVKANSVLGNVKVNKDVKIIYSPLNGSGLVPVTKVLKESGFSNVTVVEEQRNPDGHFPTCPFPNPEVREAMELGISYAKKLDADLLIATDPDCDRVGIAVKNGADFTLLTGNQVGCLLLNYICELRNLNKTMPPKPFAVTTIVSTDMVDPIAKHFGVEMYRVLTGFKYIGEVIAKHEKKHEENNYILGFEESYGYLTHTSCRDKDAVNGSFMIAEMFAYYKSKGLSLIDKLNEIYKQFGFYLNKLDNFVFEGAAGFSKMQEIMASFRSNIRDIGGYKINEVLDYSKGLNGLPKSDVLKYILKNGSTVVVRPSGTEPKLKMYSSIKASNEDEANAIYLKIAEDMKKKFK